MLKIIKKRVKIIKLVKKNGKGKEYILSTNKLIFEEEKINAKRNGIGKEYYSYLKDKEYHHILMFEGEYLNGKRNGKGKEYYGGKLVYEGEYLNGEKWNGKGKEYN